MTNKEFLLKQLSELDEMDFAIVAHRMVLDCDITAIAMG